MVRAVPFHCTVEPETNVEPFTVRVKAAIPAVPVLGATELIAGDVEVGGGVDELPLPPHPTPITRMTNKANDDQRKLSSCMRSPKAKIPLPSRAEIKWQRNSWIINQRQNMQNGAQEHSGDHHPGNRKPGQFYLSNLERNLFGEGP